MTASARWGGRPGGGLLAGPLLPSVLFSVLLTAVSLALPPVRALGHAELVSSVPAANASLRTSPPELRLTFGEPIDPATAAIRLIDGNGVAVPGLGPLSTDVGGAIARRSVPPLPRGSYTVRYRVVSASDGHVIDGAFGFLVDPTGTLPNPSSAPTTQSPADPAAIATRWAALSGGLVLFGTGLFWLLTARPVLAGRRRAAIGARSVWAVMLICGCLTFAAIAAFLRLAAQQVAAAGAQGHGGADAAFPLDFAAPFGQTSFAMAMRVALAATALASLLAGAGLIVAQLARRQRRVAVAGVAGGADAQAESRAGIGHGVPAALLVAVLLAAALGLLGASLAGHAAGAGAAFAFLDWLHLLAVGAWLGALPGFAVLAVASRSAVDERRPLLAGAFARHSRVAMVAAPVVALSGIANSPIVIGQAREVVASGYGNLALGKILLFSVALAIGSVNFFLVRRAGVRRLLQLVAAEVVVGGAAVALAAVMVSTQPAATRVPILSQSSLQTAHLYGTAGSSSVHVAVNVPAPGDQLYQVAIGDAATGGDRTDVRNVSVILHPPPGGGAVARVQLRPTPDPAVWSAAGAYTPVTGEWVLEVVIRRAGAPDATTTFPLAVTEPIPPQRVPPPDIGIGVPGIIGTVWGILPAGPLGWSPTILLLALAAALALVSRTGRYPDAGTLTIARNIAVVAAVALGICVGLRSTVAAANAVPAAAGAMDSPVTGSAESVQRGRKIYLANCSACHGVNADGNGPTAPSVVPPPGEIVDVARRSTDGQLNYLITNGYVGTPMPAFSTRLSENDRWDLVNYLRALARAPRPGER